MTDIQKTNNQTQSSTMKDKFYAFTIGAIYYQTQPKLILMPLLMNIVNTTDNDSIFYSISAGFLSSPSFFSSINHNIIKPLSVLIAADQDSFYSVSAGFMTSPNLSSIMFYTSSQILLFLKDFALNHPMILFSSISISYFSLIDTSCENCKFLIPTICNANNSQNTQNISHISSDESTLIYSDIINNFLYGAMLRLTVSPLTFIVGGALYYQTILQPYNIASMAIGYALGHIPPIIIQESTQFIVNSCLNVISNHPQISQFSLLLLVSTFKIHSDCEKCSNAELIEKCNLQSKNSYTIPELIGELFSPDHTNS